MDLAEKALEQMANTHAVRGLICTGDAFVCTAERQAFIRENFPSVIAVEMEASAIAQTCHQFNTPFVVVRAISDVADKESPMSFEEFLPLAAKALQKWYSRCWNWLSNPSHSWKKFFSNSMLTVRSS